MTRTNFPQYVLGEAQQAIVRELQTGQKLSQQDLADLTGQPEPMIKQAVGELEYGGQIERVDTLGPPKYTIPANPANTRGNLRIAGQLHFN